MSPDPRERLGGLGPLAVVGVQRWKWRFMAPFLEAGGHPVAFVSRDAAPTPGWRPVVWGAAPCPPQWDPALLVRMEDGFLHSAGLGSDLVAPMSQVIDAGGLHCDARGGSDVLTLLGTSVFAEALRARARRLRERWVAAGLTKYNLGRRAVSWRAPAGRRVVLVPGQVADDASMRHASGEVRTMEALLAAVREAVPGAWIVYRPHPDVASGNRPGLLDAGALADHVDHEADIVSLLEAAHEVHTVSSLTGFEALLRGIPVHAWGRPFYAGWGLTVDHAGAFAHRPRAATLDELVAAALILYPLYVDPERGEPITPEEAVEAMAMRAARPAAPQPARAARLAVNAARWVAQVADSRGLALP